MASQADEIDIEMQALPRRTPFGQDQGRDILEAQPAKSRRLSDSTSLSVYGQAQLGDSPTAIRVLQVDEQHDGEPAIIRCKLHVVDLAEFSTFTALSYVWGDPALCQTIWCGDQPLRVTQSAWDALCQLRRLFAPLIIWIDAICINQADAAEKARQIPLMGQIYSSATRVYVWLGPGNQKTDRAMRYLQQGALPFSRFVDKSVADLARGHCEGCDQAHQIPTGIHARIRLVLHSAARRMTLSQKAYLYAELRELFSRSWITRVWTFQEVLLSHDPVLICGGMVLHWFPFLCAGEVLAHLRKSAASEGTDNTGLTFPPTIASWLQMLNLWKSLHLDGHQDAFASGRHQPASTGAMGTTADVTISGPSSASRQSAVARPRTTAEDMLLEQITLRLHRDSMTGWHDGRILRIAVLAVDGLVALTSIIMSLLLPCPGLVIFVYTFTVHPLLHSRAVSLAIALLLLFTGLLAVYLLVFKVARAQSIGQRPLPWKLQLTVQIALRQCTNLEDRYYGVLGIIRPGASQTTPFAPLSARNTQEAYQSLCLNLVSWSQSLDFLLFTSSEQSAENPSWVVQWHKADLTCTEMLGRVETGLEKAKDSHSAPNSAARHGWCPTAPHELTIQAVLIDDICWRATTPSSASRLRRKWMICKQAYAATYPWDKLMIGAMVLFGMTSVGAAIERLPFCIKMASSADRALVRRRQSMVRGEREWGFASAPKETRVGDKLFLVSGLCAPLILRPFEANKFKVVGPAYVAGPMHGNEWTEENRARLEEIILV